MFKKSRVLAIVLVACFIMSGIFTGVTVSALSVSETEPNGKAAQANEISIGDTVSGTVSEENDRDFFAFSTPSAGRVTLNFTSHMINYSVYLYDEEGIKIWESLTNKWNEVTEMRKDTYTIDLLKGVYYLEVSGWAAIGSYGVGNYNFSTEFLSADENIEEPNNSTGEAINLKWKETVKGQIAVNDDFDYFKFTLPSAGRVAIDLTSYMKSTSLYIYDKDGEQVWESSYMHWVETSEKLMRTCKADLTAGDYYLRVDGGYSTWLSHYTGTYTFAADFVSAGETVTEPNNTVETAVTLKEATTYKGQIASNDEADYYKFVLSANDTVRIFCNSYMENYMITLFDSNNKDIWRTGALYLPENSEKRSDTHEVKLSKGTYYLKISGWDRTGNYDFMMTNSKQYFEVNYHSSNTAKAVSTKTKVIYGASTKTKTVAQLGFKKAGYSFAGWRAYRTVDKKWAAYKGSSTTVTWVALKDGKMPSGYTYATLKSGVSLSKTAISGKVDFYAQWKVVTYKITYKLNKGTNNKKNPSSYKVTTATITLKNPTRKGYTFKGWYSDSKFTKKVTRIAKGSTGNKTLYAKWAIATYKITYKLNGGKNNAKNPKNFKVTSSTIALKNATRKGYTFKGWYSDSKFKKKVTKIAKGSTGNKTLYAKWVKKK